MDLSKKAGSVDVDLYQYDKAQWLLSVFAVGFHVVFWRWLSSFYYFPFVYYHITLSLSPVLYFLSLKPPYVSLKNRFVILSFRSTRCLTHVRGAELLPSLLFFLNV